MPPAKVRYKAAHVRRARESYRRQQRASWELADVMLEAFGGYSVRERNEAGYPTLKYEIGEFLRESELPLSESEVRRIRAMAAVFPPDKRKDAAFTAHLRCMTCPEKVEDGMTVEQAELAAKGYSQERARKEATAYDAAEGVAVALRFIKGATRRLDPDKDNPEVLGERLAKLEDAVEELLGAFDGLVVA